MTLVLFFEAVILIAKLTPIIVGVIGAFLFLSPDRLPRAVTSRWYFYWPTLIVIYTVALVALFSVIGDIKQILRPEASDEGLPPNSTSQSQPQGLPPITIPPVAKLPPSSNSLNPSEKMKVAGVAIGMPIVAAIRTIMERDTTCYQIDTEDRAWTGITVTIAELDPVFQSPTVIECYRNRDDFEHIYLFPDIYETNREVFAVARVSRFKNLRVDDVRELLEQHYGFAQEPSYQPNFGSHLRWVADGTNSNLQEDCFLYLPRALESSLNNRPVGKETKQSARAQLNSYELQGSCGLVLNGFVANEDRRTSLLLVDTNRVQEYKTYAENLDEANKINQINKARRNTKF